MSKRTPIFTRATGATFSRSRNGCCARRPRSSTEPAPASRSRRRRCTWPERRARYLAANRCGRDNALLAEHDGYARAHAPRLRSATMLIRHRRTVITAILASPLVAMLSIGNAAAQELEPRSYSPSPVGTTFIVVSATRSTGGGFTDPSIPFTDVDATVKILGLAIGHTFALAGKQALLLGAVPVTWGTASGAIGEDRHSANRTGLADPRIRLSVILAGSAALSRADFALQPRRTILASSITVAPPVGQYDASKLINLGSHRWAFKPEIGVSVPLDRWTLDAYAGVWLFTANETFYPGSSLREQDPIVALQAHVSYTLARRSWLAVNATWYSGGRTTIDSVDKADLLRNARLGATWAQPLNARQSVKVSYNAGATTRRGADFRTITAAWQFVF